ncbi:hypothetical protein AFIC_001667 [[Pseudomonas] carboxydohydrogena]|uniref:Uncharacterized protein n=1 Tax=Afipia carboxydohydrogena TaxID=290 RepID=A0ABY8BMK0_AFICR|nr:hypothetical protein [[Pseudomonas] carboxydohydrogena]WEF50144.1 hypothetical protein AFIC_001667 [[Pseudomonas] carboxydohydrogena]
MMLEAKLADPPKILGAAAVAGFAALALILLPSLAPQVEASEPATLARGDKLAVAGVDCARQDWPNISAVCLRRGDATPRPVPTHIRMVATR